MKFEDIKPGMKVRNLITRNLKTISRVNAKTRDVHLKGGGVRVWENYGKTWVVVEPVKVTKAQAEDLDDLLSDCSKIGVLNTHKDLQSGGGWVGYSSLNDISIEQMELIMKNGYAVEPDPESEVGIVEAAFGENAISELLDDEVRSHPTCSHVLDSFRYTLDETVSNMMKNPSFDKFIEGDDVKCYKNGELAFEGTILSIKPLEERFYIQHLGVDNKQWVNYKAAGRTWEIMKRDEATSLTDEDLQVLREMFIDLALDTNDTEWFNEILVVK